MGVCLHKNNAMIFITTFTLAHVYHFVWERIKKPKDHAFQGQFFLIKDIEFSCPILPLNNLPKVCYDTSQENKVLWRERFWLIEGEGGSSHRRPLGVKSWLVTGEMGGEGGGRVGPLVRGQGVEPITPDYAAKIYAFIYRLLSSLKKILGEL